MDFSGIPQPVSVPQGIVVPGEPGMVAPPGGDGVVQGYDPSVPGMYNQMGEFVEVKNLMADGGNRFGVSAVAFDAQEELLWMGNQGGHATSYYGLDMQKYTSFQMHEVHEIRQLLTVDHQLLALTSDSLRCFSKFGRPAFKHMTESLQDMQCMLLTGKNSLLMGGHQPTVIELDLETQQEVRQVDVEEPGCAIFRYSTQYVCAGDTSGKVTLRDPKTLKAEHVLQAHSGTLSDFDVHSNQLITCGFSTRMGSLSVDRFLMVYDLRMLRATNPMQMSLEPCFLRFVPTYTNRILVVSQTGQFQILEQGAVTASSMMTYQVQTEGTALLACDISPSCNALAFGDSGGYLHLFASGEQPTFNSFSKETEFPSVDHIAPMSINNELTPLSVIPMQYPSNGKLLSDWPEELCRKIYRKPVRIAPEIMRTVKMAQNVGYAPNPGLRKRNQVSYRGAMGGAKKDSSGRKASVPDSPIGRGEDPFLVIPKRYRKVEIKYSKLGVEDFDFRHYNKTNFAGLETHIPNAYCNCMLQVLYFVEPLRCLVLSHLCDREFCLTCELAFLFHMLDTQKGKTCQASNFLRAFRTVPEASALGLVLGDAEESLGKADLPHIIQKWNRFILQQVHSDMAEALKGLELMEPVESAENYELTQLEWKEPHTESAPTEEQPAEDKEKETVTAKGEKEAATTGDVEGEDEGQKAEGEEAAVDGEAKDLKEEGEEGGEPEKTSDSEKVEEPSSETADKEEDKTDGQEETGEPEKEEEKGEPEAEKSEEADKPEEKTDGPDQEEKKTEEESETKQVEESPEEKPSTEEAASEDKEKEEAAKPDAETSKEGGTEPAPETKKDGEKLKKDGATLERSPSQHFDDVPVPETIIKQLFGCLVENRFRCKCGQEMVRHMTSSVQDLSYPDTTGATTVPQYKFGQIVARSLGLEQSMPAWCNKCNNYQPHVQSKTVQALPDILALNCHMESTRNWQFWKRQEEFYKKKDDAELQTAPIKPSRPAKMCRYGSGCTRKDCKFRHESDIEKMEKEALEASQVPDDGLPEGCFLPIGLSARLLPNGKVEVENIEEDADLLAAKDEEQTYIYELYAVVSHIREAKMGGHLVSHLKAGEAYHLRKERVTCTQWYLINDFSIAPVEKENKERRRQLLSSGPGLETQQQQANLEKKLVPSLDFTPPAVLAVHLEAQTKFLPPEVEAVHFCMEWRVPCVLYFARRYLFLANIAEMINPITADVLFQDASLVTPRRKHVTFLPLDESEIPKEGDVIGLDAEFVTLNQEEAELRSDGTRSMIKPSQMSVARITCVRGQGPLAGEPFLDDYISTQEQVVDYLTQFSGIKPGDLDATISNKYLTTLKSTYLKLRYLTDAGVIFVGHGLKKDFRVINLVIPKGQVIDTVELFQLPRQRMISLKFLAWYFLDMNIQSVTHDSIEDARTALKLYHKYKEMSKDGMDNVREKLKEMYEKGRKLQWKIPGKDEEDTAAAAASLEESKNNLINTLGMDEGM